MIHPFIQTAFQSAYPLVLGACSLAAVAVVLAPSVAEAKLPPISHIVAPDMATRPEAAWLAQGPQALNQEQADVFDAKAGRACEASLPWEQRNLLITRDSYGQDGICLLPDSVGFIAIHSFFAGISGPVLDWMVNWMYQDELHYKVAHPTQNGPAYWLHPDRDYYPEKPPWLYNSAIFALELADDARHDISLAFLPPLDCGLDMLEVQQANMQAVHCARILNRDQTVAQGWMLRLAQPGINSQGQQGLIVRTYYWLGAEIRLGGNWTGAINWFLNIPYIRSRQITPGVVERFGRHMALETERLRMLLPDLYRTFGTTR